MKTEVIHTYAGNTDKTFKMLADPEGHVKKHEAAGCKNIVVDSCEVVDGGVVIKLTRDAPSTAPAFARKFVGEYNTMMSEDIWYMSDTPTKKGTFHVDTKGAPVVISGIMDLRPTKGGGSEVVINLDLKVKVPLIGGKIEKVLMKDIIAALDSDEAFFQEYEKTYV